MSNAPHTSVRRDVEIQRRYYSDTASSYETMHAHEGAADAFSRDFVHSTLRLLNVQSVLDVGAATGRGLRDFRNALPGVFVCGVEPVAALLQQGRASGNISGAAVLRAGGEALPFPDNTFDAVCEFATLHHVPNPSAVVREMLRVARKVVVIADSNRFGQGFWPVRLLKLFIYKFGLWRAFSIFFAQAVSVIKSLKVMVFSIPTAYTIPTISLQAGRIASCFSPATRASPVVGCILFSPPRE